jgi:hypothetical protein
VRECRRRWRDCEEREGRTSVESRGRRRVFSLSPLLGAYYLLSIIYREQSIAQLLHAVIVASSSALFRLCFSPRFFSTSISTRTARTPAATPPYHSATPHTPSRNLLLLSPPKSTRFLLSHGSLPIRKDGRCSRSLFRPPTSVSPALSEACEWGVERSFAAARRKLGGSGFRLLFPFFILLPHRDMSSNATELLFGAYLLLPAGTDVFGYLHTSLKESVRSPFPPSLLLLVSADLNVLLLLPASFPPSP